MPKVIPGINVGADTDFAFLNGARVGVLSNQASIDTRGNHLVDLLMKSHCTVKKLFAAEHGFLGTAQDMIPIERETSEATGIEIISLYGDSIESLYPAPEDFQDLDILIVDLPDIGSRYYTFSQTMAYCMRAAGQAGVKVVVLDRPNPIGGLQIEGSTLTKACRSFCGIGPIANRHGMTLGELATMFRTGFGEGEATLEPHLCELEVIRTVGWKRSQYLDKTTIPWVKPSPNMPFLDTAIIYPGACLFEATNLSEGRGTDRPFEWIGAPWIDSNAWIDATKKVGLPTAGVALSVVDFTPKFQKHAGKLCRGIQIQVEDRQTFQPYRFGMALLIAAAQTFPCKFAWRKEPYEFIDKVPAIDLLYGDSTLRMVSEGRSSIDEIVRQLTQFESWYQASRTGYFLY
ncbi:MAG: DUF1343 domain-containing protein [Verrucomicrobia bacterium]|nr:DUF1343 domain-containing protein [Verrucomicrobiota bacterium]MDA1069743.1 DUF1343 domain-containing protein [Verrucomicrobiota bacterium]